MQRLSRLFVIMTAYVAASVVAGVVALLGILIATAGFVVLRPAALAELVAPMAVASMVAGASALLPTVPVGIYAEKHRRRALAWYSRAGVGIGLAALLLYVIASELVSRSVSNANAADISFLATLAVSVMLAGLCSGVAYWAIAGRHAGADPVPPVADANKA